MALHLSISLLLTGLTGVYSVTTVTRVSVKAGDSVSIPCLYHPKYTSHVKYLCQGYPYEFCSYAVKTNWQSSGRFLISDDREKKVFTVTIKDVREGYKNFWCVVEINERRDVGNIFPNVSHKSVFTVTMSGLKMEDSGWYWCSRGDLQMPVQIIVREKPSTTAQPETFTSPELVSPSTTNEAEKPSTTDETEKPSTTDEDAPNRSAALH
ncbi:hypothetical protein D4764_11G0007450 [Takifugu flavidus]|uniref:Immunoglobulin domain-containing protein n=1 Tax=Takifugu flavidus TaxID=433684 RepID=A0A5C6PFR1_9TELE|nr:hypothetical protein D4764_11G0007450 [Takifugu flavidus]